MWWLVLGRGSNIAGSDNVPADAANDKPALGDEPRLWIPEPTSQEERGAALGAQIGHLVNRPDLIRQRAQNSAAISGAAATAVAGFAALSGLARGELPLILLGLVLCSWLAAMAIYAHAITYSHTDKLRRQRGDEPEAKRLADVVNAFTLEAAELRKRVRRGRAATGLASALTFVVVVLLISGITHTTQNVQISLTAAGATGVARSCDWEKPRERRLKARGRLKAEVNPSDLDKQFVALKVPDCNHADMTTVHVRNRLIRAIARDR